MQATMLPFPYAISCQPYVDISTADSSVTSSSGTPSPPALSYHHHGLYDTMLAPRNGASFTSLHSPYQHKRFVAKSSLGRKKSFTIEAILGLDDDDGRIAESRRQDTHLSPQKSYAVPSATPRTALTALFAATAEEACSNKDSKSRLSHPSSTTEVESRFNLPNSPSPKQTINHNHPKAISHSGKIKRIRTIFTPEQLERLEAEFERQQYMVGPERLYLASALNLTEAQVKVWFQNRRIKWRKQHLEMQQARLAQLREAETGESEPDQDQTNLPKDMSSPGHWEDLMDERN